MRELQFILVIDLLFVVFYWILVARFFLCWIPNVIYYHPVVRLFYWVTDYVVQPFRGILPPVGAIEFSPLIMFFLLRLAYSLLRRILFILLLQCAMWG